MPSIVPLRSITDARIEVVQRQRRAAAFAQMTRAWGTPLLRPVNPAEPYCEDPDANDVAVGLYARLGCSGQNDLSGLLVIRERPVALGHAELGGRVAAPERLFFIEALTVSSSMTSWRPPVQTLLAATAAALVATIHHDPGFQTYVAFRVPEGDSLAEEAVAMIGGRSMPPVPLGSPPSFIGGVPDQDLRFLDARAAASATKLVLDHMFGAVSPFQPPSSQPNGRTWHRQLSVEFPRALHHLAEEIRLVASGAVDVGWSVPRVAENDTDAVDIANVARS
jgi:hypothetical protein